MSPLINSLRGFRGGGMNTDDNPESVIAPDYISAQNFRVTGTSAQEAGYGTNPESDVIIDGVLLDGINNIIGGGAFQDIGKVLAFRYNSAGNHQILLYDTITNTYDVIFTDLTDSDGVQLLQLNPQNWVKAILVNRTFVIWWAKDLEVGYTNLNTLASGGYGTVQQEDLRLLKPQILEPPIGTYGSDEGQPVNNLFGKLPQFIVQGVNDDFNYTAWSTRSKRIVPYQQNTPVSGSDVSQNNYIIVSVDIGSIRNSTINVGVQFDDSGVFSTIKSVQRSYVVALSNVAVNVSTEVYEAYNPSTNLYSFVFYNNVVTIPIAPTETDLLYDYIWPSNAGGLINGNITALADFMTLYARPNTSVTIAGVGYNPNIAIPAGTYPDPLTAVRSFPGASGSGAGNHRRIISITLGGTPHTGDKIITITADIRDANATENRTYEVPSALDGNLAGVIAAYTPFFGTGNYTNNGDGTYTITWTDIPYYGLQQFSVQLFFAGATVSNSISTILDNCPYQAALAYWDDARPFPIETNSTFQFSTPSYAQVLGNAIQVSWKINTLAAPKGATGYQWLITAPPITKVLDTIATPLNYLGTWNASSNTPTLAPNAGTVGGTYQITTPAMPSISPYHDLGTGEAYPTGGYVVYNGQSWNVLQRDFGDLTTTGNVLAFSLNSLKLFNDAYNQQGVNTNLVYDFAQGDRCTLHYYLDGTIPVYLNNPCVNLSVFGYDSGSYVVRVEKSANFDASVLAGKNVFLRLYSPAPIVSNQKDTVWYEIGERFTITNGNHDTLQGSFTDGGAYYKTRQFDDALAPYADPPIEVLATDLNYSDFYPSEFWSKGRPRTFYDVLEQTEQKASIITSQPYILGSKVNGLNRFYPANIYGEGDGQTSSSKGAIQILDQRGNVLLTAQEQGIFYIPVNEAYQVLNAQLTGVAISEKLLNNGRYDPEDVGIGTAKESWCNRYSMRFMIDPNKSLPYEVTGGGIFPISQKMSKYFKSTLQQAYSLGKKLFMFYHDFYEEPTICVQGQDQILQSFPFTSDNWDAFNHYTVAPGDIIPSNGTHSTVSYDNITGIATYTPDTDYVGTDTAPFDFPGHTVNACLQWTAGSGDVNPFVFAPLTGVPLSTSQQSNTVLVSGNDFPVVISITGDSGLGYSINGAPFVSTPGTVNSGDSVQVEVDSSGSLMTSTSCTLTIDSQSATFTVTTRDAGNFTAYAQYGMSIVSIQDGSATGTPAGFNPCNLSPGQSLSLAYTALTGSPTDTISVVLTGSPAIPGHTRLFLSVNGVNQGTQNLVSGGSFSLVIGTGATDPDLVVVGIETF